MSLTKLLVNLKDELENLNNTIEELVVALERGQAPQNEEPDLELPQKPKIKLEDIRKELAKKASKGHSDEIRRLLKTYGAEKLSDVDPKDYEDLFLEAQGGGRSIMASPKVHATLSASSAHRWLSAPPLPQLEKFFPKDASPMAAEGTAAHALGEYKLRKTLGQKVKQPASDFDNDDMEAYTDDYCSYVMEEFQKVKLSHPGATVLIEQRLDFSKYVPDGFGTGDCVIIADGMMHIIDFKYGKGVRVAAENNPQMRHYNNRTCFSLKVFCGRCGDIYHRVAYNYSDENGFA